VADNPPSLNWDEVSHGFNAFSILKTGRDEWGLAWPLIFRCFGDFKLPLYIYLSTIPVALLGLTPLAVRMVSVLSGAGLILVAFFLAKKTFKSDLAALLAALLTAISPWSLFLSRVAVEANLGTFLFALGGLFWLRWWEGKKSLLPTALFWGLSLFAYNSARVLVPLVFLATVGLALVRKRGREIIFPVLVLFVFFLPVVSQFLDQCGGARFGWVSLVDQGAVNKIIEQRTNSTFSPVITRLLYNRPAYFVSAATKNYFGHFSKNFLFVAGGDNYQFSLPGQGLLYLVCFPFLLIGLVEFLVKKRWFLLTWLLLALVPSAITRDSPHVLRSILVLPLPMVITAAGLLWVVNWLKKRSTFGGRAVLIVFVLGLFVSLAFWWRLYWQKYRVDYSWAWQDGQQELVESLKQKYNQYDLIVVTKKYGEPHEFILFWWPWSPKSYQTDESKKWDYHARWYWIDGFDKFEFWNDWEVKDKLKEVKGKFLLVTSPGNWLREGKLLQTITSLNGDVVFELVEYNYANE